MLIKPSFPLRSKTTMRIGGTAKYFSDVTTKQDVEDAVRFAKEKNVPILPLGSGSNTIFAEGEIAALVVQVKHASVSIDGQRVSVGAGKNLAMLINELAEKGLDLSALTGIPGTIGGAIFGNAGQGPKGIWIDSFVESVTAYVEGEWKTLTREECGFGYRESAFNNAKCKMQNAKWDAAPILWETVLKIPTGNPMVIKANVQTLLQKRIETQPHLKTAGSCFKAVGETPAWQLIDATGLRGFKAGGVEISPKHANFLINTGEGTFQDAVKVVENVRSSIPKNLDVEMRFVWNDGTVRF